MEKSRLAIDGDAGKAATVRGIASHEQRSVIG